VTEALKKTNQYQQQSQAGVSINNNGQILRDAPINRIVENLLDFAIQSRASDIHIEPQVNRIRVRYRIDGILTEKLILPKNVHDAVVSRIKIMSNLKIDEKRLPQDGRFNFKSQGKEIDLRVSTLPTVNGEKVVMRLLEKNTAVPSLQELGLNGLALQRVMNAIKVPHGIILVTGPTGSGKTTTLYSVLHLINSIGVNIMTLEDPVEYQIPGVSQVQVNPKAGLTFASGLRSFLRQDPDIIMVGEIRDNETADLALQASLTGHLVFSTLHTNSAAGALPRLLDMEAEPFLLSSSMLATLGQRVVRMINPQYKEEYKPEPVVIEDIKKVLGNHFINWCKEHNKDPNNITLFRPSENRPSTEPDFKGRIGIFEVMPSTPEIAKLVLNRASSAQIEQVAQQQGMLLMKQDGYLKALEGITTIEEVLRVAEVG
jgi:type IV pilus assembly protein PilB